MCEGGEIQRGVMLYVMTWIYVLYYYVANYYVYYYCLGCWLLINMFIISAKCLVKYLVDLYKGNITEFKCLTVMMIMFDLFNYV